MEVTRRPQALRSRPMLLAVTPFPRPLTTPPVTRTYFIFLILFLLLEIRTNLDSESRKVMRKQEVRGVSEFLAAV